jgi:regulatory protein
VEGALARLDAAGLLNDPAYAANYVQTRSLRGRGPARLRRDLRAMGVDAEVIDRALRAQYPDGADLGEVVLPLARRRAVQLGPLPRPIKRRRLLGYLARRGFAGRAITELVEKVLAAGS